MFSLTNFLSFFLSPLYYDTFTNHLSALLLSSPSLPSSAAFSFPFHMDLPPPTFLCVEPPTRPKCPKALVNTSPMSVRAHLRPGTYHVLVLMALRRICGTGAQGDGSLLNALSRKCYMHMLQYVHRGTLP